MSTVQALPGAFPLHENKDFISESEWVIFKLLCRSMDSWPDNTPDELSHITGRQVSPERCDMLIRTVEISHLSGLGTWIARLLAATGLNADDVRHGDASEIMHAVNDKAGYPICNEATIHGLSNLQRQWKGDTIS